MYTSPATASLAMHATTAPAHRSPLSPQLCKTRLPCCGLESPPGLHTECRRTGAHTCPLHLPGQAIA